MLGAATSAFPKNRIALDFAGVNARKRGFMMRVGIVEDVEGKAPARCFPQTKPSGQQANQAIDEVGAARQYLPLVLTSVNSAESIFATATATTKSDLPAVVSTGSAYGRLADKDRICRALLNRANVMQISVPAEELLERDCGRRSPRRAADFTCIAATNRRGFCLSIRLVAAGSSATMECDGDWDWRAFNRRFCSVSRPKTT
jgi:hypothetical protein